MNLTELQQGIKNVDVRLQKENENYDHQCLTDRHGYLDHELSKRKLAQELAGAQADIIRMAEEINAAHPGRVTLPDFSKIFAPVPELTEVPRQDNTELSSNFPSEKVVFQKAHQERLEGDVSAKLKAQSSALAESSMSDATERANDGLMIKA